MAVQSFGSGAGGFPLSPGVNVSEVDLTTIIPSVDTTTGAFAGVFRWGPANERTLVNSENDLVRKFGRPTNLNAETFFTAANFLAYSNSLIVSRAIDANTQFAAIGVEGGSISGSNTNITVYNNNDFETKSADWGSSGVQYIARWPGDLGNSLKVSVCESADQFSSITTLDEVEYELGAEANTAAGNTALFDGANTGFTIEVGSNQGVIVLDGGPSSSGYDGFDASLIDIEDPLTSVAGRFAIGDFVRVSSGFNQQSLKIVNKTIAVSNTAGVNTGVGTITLTFDQPLKLASSVSTNEVERFWEYAPTFGEAPGRSQFVERNGNIAAQNADPLAQRDEMHIVVVDEDGQFSGNPGGILEVYSNVSRATDARLEDGSANYFKTVINNQSRYVWAAADRPSAVSATAANVQSALASAPLTLSLVGGVDLSEEAIPFTSIATAYDQFVSQEDVDVSLIMTGAPRGGLSGEQLPNYIIDNIAETRKDVVVFVSPPRNLIVNVPSPEQGIVEFRGRVRSSSYAVMDTGYKYQYDKYNDVYRWVPLNGDIAGTCVRTDASRDPWFSPAGSTRGQIRNVLKLAFNPNKAQRDLLYRNNINPVISQPGEGVILFGDKTLLNRPSAFDRINVRRLFITLEKAIANASRSFMFEFNDEFTRAQFVNIVEPFLRDVQGRRGIFDFRVVCDESNNTAEVVDSNRFVGDIYIKPARAINFIQLNFVAVRSGVEFSELVG